jgi:N-acyl amino acid synthase of PEP-CTERM/exosortase system
MSGTFRAVTLDDSPALLTKSYRLRYQVYCLERKFLRAEDYPDHQEVDQFDRDSVHVGVLDLEGDLVGTARLVMPGRDGLPLLHHCRLFPQITTLGEVRNRVVEVSRVSISRHFARRQGDPPFDAATGAAVDAGVSAVHARQRRQHRAEPFLTLLKAIIYGAKRAGATHLIGATDAALHRWLLHYGFPYRLSGPEAEYYGRIAPYIMSLAEFDAVVLSRRFAVLDEFPVGTDPECWPAADALDQTVARVQAGEGPVVRQ